MQDIGRASECADGRQFQAELMGFIIGHAENHQS
jgi:hypothetical protein